MPIKKVSFYVIIILLLTVCPCLKVYAGSYTDNGNGTVTDNNTGLIWQQEDDGLTRYWEEALTYCEDLVLGGESDWRLPNIKELSSLTDRTVYDPAIDSNYFSSTESFWYWSSTANAGSLSSVRPWLVNFYNAESDYNGHSFYANVRCMRDGKSGLFPYLDIKVNGSDSDVRVLKGSELLVTVTLDPRDLNGENADWWVYGVSDSLGTYYYTFDQWWTRSDMPIRTYGGPLFNLSSYTALKITTLPAGTYTFYFEVDNNMDGVKDGTYKDFAEVIIE